MAHTSFCVDIGVYAEAELTVCSAGGAGNATSGDAREGAAVAGLDGLSLMQLELTEEDQPAVVPYEEVCDVAGSSYRSAGGGGQLGHPLIFVLLCSVCFCVSLGLPHARAG